MYDLRIFSFPLVSTILRTSKNLRALLSQIREVFSLHVLGKSCVFHGGLTHRKIILKSGGQQLPKPGVSQPGPRWCHSTYLQMEQWGLDERNPNPTTTLGFQTKIRTRGTLTLKLWPNSFLFVRKVAWKAFLDVKYFWQNRFYWWSLSLLQIQSTWMTFRLKGTRV